MTPCIGININTQGNVCVFFVLYKCSSALIFAGLLLSTVNKWHTQCIGLSHCPVFVSAYMAGCSGGSNP